MADTGFNPRGRADPGRIAPTEQDAVLRHTHVHGEVHDENAWAMGGVAGHAGLFGTAMDVARFARHVLGGTGPDDERLGWVRAEHRPQVAEPLSAAAFGHTGFTGTSVWIDPERDLFVVLLTNRVNPTREGTGIAGLRRAVRAAAIGAGSGD